MGGIFLMICRACWMDLRYVWPIKQTHLNTMYGKLVRRSDGGDVSCKKYSWFLKYKHEQGEHEQGENSWVWDDAERVVMFTLVVGLTLEYGHGWFRYGLEKELWKYEIRGGIENWERLGRRTGRIGKKITPDFWSINLGCHADGVSRWRMIFP